MVTRLIAVCLLELALISSLQAANDVAKPANPEAELRHSLDNFYTAMLSGNDKRAKSAIARFFVDQKHVESLFPKDSKPIWKVLAQARERFLANAGQIAAGQKKLGKPTKIKVIDLRSVKERQAYGRVLSMIPKNVPVYRIVETYANGNGGGGSSAYIKVNGEWVWFPGFMSIPELLEGKLEPVEKPAK